MTEQTDVRRQGEVVCSKCRKPIGQIVEFQGVDFLQLGGMMCRDAHGVCVQCGTEFHWSTRDKLLEKIIKSCEKPAIKFPKNF